MSVRIYTYGLPFGPCDQDAQAVDEQIFRARIYKNDLIAIERSRRAAVRSMISKVANIAPIEAEYAKMTAEIAEVRQRIKKQNAISRSRTATATDRSEVKLLTSRRKIVRASLKEAKAALRDNVEVQLQIKECNDRANHMIRLYRGACRVYWGTYLVVEAAVKAASKKSDPRHRKWDGRGCVSVQLQGGLPVASLWGDDKRIQIDPVSDQAWTGSRGQRRRLTRTTCRIRIGSDAHREPIWASFPLILHRKLPKDGIVKWARAQRRRIGTRWRWELQLTIESESFGASESVGCGSCAIDVGWRKRPNGDLRIGYLVDDYTANKELRLPYVIPSKLAHSDSIRSIRDRNFNDFRVQLTAWMADNSPPDWLRSDLSHFHSWRSLARLTKTALKWSDNRFAGDDDIFADLDAWRKQDRHLYQWEASEREKTLGRRREHYRMMATEICRKYSKVVIEDFDLRKMARRASAEDEDEQHASARSQRSVAAISEFRQALSLAASNAGAEIILVPSPHTTTTCNVCKHDCSTDPAWDPADRLEHTCTSCGTKWDQDENAARNILALHIAPVNTAAA